MRTHQCAWGHRWGLAGPDSLLWESPPAPSFPPGLGRVHPGSLRLATERVCPKGDTQFTLGSVSVYCRLMSVLLRGCVWLCERGCSLAAVSGRLQHWTLAVRRLQDVPASGAAVHGLSGSLAWGPPGSRTEPVSPALAGRFLTTREPHTGALYKRYTPELVYQRSLDCNFKRLGSLTLTVFLEKLHRVSSDEERGA